MDITFNKPPESQDLGRSTRGIQKPGTADLTGRLNVTAWSKELVDLMSEISRLPEVRETRVREIKESIHSGVYAVDPRKIAEAIVKNL
jgi:flagellar biosynthesis anti-sigma factor FlgM